MKQSKNPDPIPKQEAAATQEALPMQVTAKIHSIHMEGQVLADASANINGCFAIRGIRIVQGSDGPFASMPSSSQAPHPSLPGKARKLTRCAAPPLHGRPASLGSAVIIPSLWQAVVGAYQQELAQLYDRRMGNVGQQQPAQAAPEMGMQM